LDKLIILQSIHDELNGIKALGVLNAATNKKAPKDKLSNVCPKKNMDVTINKIKVLN